MEKNLDLSNLLAVLVYSVLIGALIALFAWLLAAAYDAIVREKNLERRKQAAAVAGVIATLLYLVTHLV